MSGRARPDDIENRGLSMKSFVFCLASAICGATVAIVLYDPPETQPRSIAQEVAAATPDTPPSPIPANWVAAPADDPVATPPPTGDDDLTPEERVNVWVYQHANRSAVNVNTKTIQTDAFFMVERTSAGEGSGTVIDRQGHVVTNFHVIDGAREIQVTLFNGQTYDATLVGVDPATDIAVLKIDAPAETLFPVAFGSSTTLQVGQRVFAIGNPFGLERTLSTGIISSLNRSLPRRQRRGTIKSIIQIDASINPGNSGGPLLDSRGRMIGINTAIASTTGESAGVGFAIPIDTVSRVVPQLIRDGRVERADIGIARVYRSERGLLIASLERGGAAEKAGLQGPKVVRRLRRRGSVVYEYQTVDRSAADLIVAVDKKRIRTADDLLDAVESHKPGDEVVVTVIRDGQAKQIKVTLEAEE